MEVYGVIYIITCLLNGMKYVGQTTRSVEKRFKEHAGSKTHLGYAIQKYGQENFTIEVIEMCATSEQLDEREIFWIAKLNCKHPNGYNLTDGGKGSKGLTEETLERMRTPKSPETVLRMTAASKKRTETSEGKATLDKARKSRWEKEKARPPEERGWIRRNRKNVFPIIETELRRRKIKYSTLANYIGLPKGNIERKLNGKVSFSIEEAEAVKNFLGLDMTLEELFIRDDGFGAEKTFSTKRMDWDTYPVLKAELTRQQIKTVDLAKHLGLCTQSVTRKLQGKVSISLEQKKSIIKFLNVEMSVEELFKRNE